MLVSVIIPCYNVEHYISECIESVLAQSYSRIEIICVDNNSTDGTRKVLDKYLQTYPYLTVISELRKGASAARNAGLKISRGQWVQFLDADDLLLPQKIEHQVKIVKNHPQAAFVAAAYYLQPFKRERSSVMPDCNDPFKALFVTKLGITSANFFNTDKIRQVGGWEESLGSSQEAELMFKILKNYRDMSCDISPFTVIRERESGQISQSDPKKKWVRYIQLRLDIIRFLKKERPEYFLKENEFFLQNVFSQIRVLAKYDLETAVTFYQNNFTNEFVPTHGSKFSLYTTMFKILGFRKAEQISILLSKNISK
jgi:glycosyltransferase involved in cell wall biosynthesis